MREDCYGCPARTPICHGKDEQGNWRCKDWGRRQAEKDALRKAKTEDKAMQGYYGARHIRIELRKKSHHK